MTKDAVISHPDLFLLETLVLPAVENAGGGQLPAESLWEGGDLAQDRQSPPPGQPRSDNCSPGNTKAQLPASIWDISAEPSQLRTGTG